MSFQELDDLDEIIHNEKEITIMKNDLKKQKEELNTLQNDFSRIINVMNEQISDLREELSHIKKNGNKFTSYLTEEQKEDIEKVILCNYFKFQNELEDIQN